MRKRICKVISFHCPECNVYSERVVKTEDFGNPVHCDCGTQMSEGDVSKPLYWKPFTPYYHTQLEQTFMTKDDEKRYTKKHGMVDISGEVKAWKSGRGSWRNR